jgi:hypothetical protein
VQLQIERLAGKESRAQARVAGLFYAIVDEADELSLKGALR